MKILFILVLIIIFISIIWYISVSNKLKRLSIKVQESSSGIDVALTKRYDVLTQMVDVVKGYIKYEKDILTEIVKIRKDMTLKEKSDINKIMNERFERINGVVENYPELKASDNYKILQKSILDVEEHLQAARRLYNSNVSIYNEVVISFPTCIVAKNKKMTEKDFFEAEEIKKDDVKI